MGDSVEPPTVLEKRLVTRPSIAQPSSSVSLATSDKALAAVEAERMRGLLTGIAGSSLVVVSVFGAMILLTVYRLVTYHFLK